MCVLNLFHFASCCKKTSISPVFCCCCCLCSYFESYKKINLILSFVISWSYFFCNKNFVRSILSLTFSSKKLTVECYQSLIRLKKFSKPTRTSMASSGLSVRRRVTRSVAQRSELVAIMGCGVDLQHLVTVSRKYLQLSFSFINICNYRKTFYRLTFTVVIYCSWLVWSSAFVLFRPTNSLETPLLGKLVKQRDLFCQAERPLKTRRSKTLPHKSHRYGIFTSNCHFFYCTSLSLCSLLLFTVITCGDPGTPLNGQQADVKNGYNYGGSVKFICKDNYTLSGTSEIFCEETKDWSSPTPKCWGKSKLTLN